MHDFYYGSRESIMSDLDQYLIAVKHSLPRWANSLPDSEFRLLKKYLENPVFERSANLVETGVGASTLLLIHHAMMTGGHVFSWDTNASKASFIRSVCADTLEKVHNKSISEHWTFISGDSTDPYIGLAIIGELTKKIHFSHHDSDHTWNTVSQEIEALLPLYEENSLVCVDDANQNYEHVYEPIININRRKIGLEPIKPINDNRGEPLFARIPTLLASRFDNIELISDQFPEFLEDDPFYSWYDVDRKNMAELNMEQMDTLKWRFAAWRISGLANKERDNKNRAKRKKND